MSIYKLDIEEVAKRLSASFDAQLEDVLVAQLTRDSEVIIRKIAREMCNNLKTNITGYNCHSDPYGKVAVSLIINGVSEKI